MTKPRLTVIVGAGASIDAGCPGVPALTDVVARLRTPRAIGNYPEFMVWDKGGPAPRQFPLAQRPSAPVVSLIIQGLRANGTPINFETILHAVETLEPYAATTTFAQELGNVRPVIASFTDPTPRYNALFNYPLLWHTRWEIVRTVRDAVLNGAINAKPNVLPKIFKFLDGLSAAFLLDVQNLNYDDLLERNRQWADGFIAQDGAFSAFDRAAFLEAQRNGQHTMAHLHGSVLFGYATYSQEAVQYMTSRRQLVKYADAESATKSIEHHPAPPNYTDGVIDEASPIISGANKVLKLGTAPYAYYYSALQAAVQRNSRLLFIGYGFMDPHINLWARETIEHHGEQLARVAIVDYKPPGDAPWRLQTNPTFAELSQRLGTGRLDLSKARELITDGRIAVSGAGFPPRSDVAGKLIDWLTE